MGQISLKQALADVKDAAGELDSENACLKVALGVCMQKVNDVLVRGLTPETRRGLRSAHRMAAASLGVDHD
jgi:hypothetical protein